MKRLVVGGIITTSFFIGISVGFVGSNWINKPKDISHKLEKLDQVEYEKHNTQTIINDDVLRSIANGNLRLYVSANPKSSAGMDDDQRAKCELHATNAQRIISITKRADECSTRLNGLQEWVSKHLK